MPEGKKTRDPVVAVVGGGVSGLAAARVLAGLEPVSSGGHNMWTRGLPSRRVVVFEAGPELGGKVSTGSLADHPVELGPDQFLRRDPSTERLCRHLGLGDDLVAPSASSAAVWSRGQMRELPKGLVLGVPTDLETVASSGIISAVGIARARRDAELDGPLLTAHDVGLGEEGRAGKPELSAGEILRARLGDELVDYLVDPLLGGINAGSVDTLSLGVVAPQVARALVGRRDVVAPLAAALPPVAGDKAAESPFFGLRGGLARMVEACAAELLAAGVEIRTGTPVAAIRPGAAGSPSWSLDTSTGTVDCDGIVLAVPGPAGAALTGGLSPVLARELGAIAYATVAVVTFAFPKGAFSVNDRWTGVLVPRVEGRLMTAATWLSLKWPWMSSPTTCYVRVSAGRFGDERISALGDEELASKLASELRTVAGIAVAPTAQRVTRYEHCLPQYQPGHSSHLAAIAEAVASTGRLELAGALLGGIGLPACMTSGEAAANRLLVDLAR
ncbi:MAG: protoporphyrinogen oxidase [Acidimicrobiales bacterium]